MSRVCGVCVCVGGVCVVYVEYDVSRVRVWGVLFGVCCVAWVVSVWCVKYVGFSLGS